MLEPLPGARSLMLVLHDVAPETWPDYQPFVQAVDAIGGVPMTWLVVPDFHQRNPLLRSPAFCRLLERRLAQGDELALHGYYHADDGPPPRTPGEYFMRRIYTHEGEFHALDQQQALQRLQHGLDLFGRQGWPVAGFVAPAWLMSEGTRQALRQLPLRYTCIACQNSLQSKLRAWCGAPAAPGAAACHGWSATGNAGVGAGPKPCAWACTRWTCVIAAPATIG